MQNMSHLTDEQLEKAQLMGAATYLRAYVHRMARQLDVNDKDIASVDKMVVELVEPLNIATEAAWRALMEDTDGIEDALDRFKSSLDNIDTN